VEVNIYFILDGKHVYTDQHRLELATLLAAREQ